MGNYNLVLKFSIAYFITTQMQLSPFKPTVRSMLNVPLVKNLEAQIVVTEANRQYFAMANFVPIKLFLVDSTKL